MGVKERIKKFLCKAFAYGTIILIFFFAFFYFVLSSSVIKILNLLNKKNKV